MSTRFSFVPIVRAHWRGLSRREPQVGQQPHYPGDRVARFVTVGLPLVAFSLTVAFLLRQPKTVEFDPGMASLAVGWAALVSAGLLAAFALIGAWRSRLSERKARDDYYERKEWPFRALLDESVAHTLLGVLDSIVVVVAAVAAVVPKVWIRYPAIGLAVAAGAHLCFLFVILVTRLYSAYAQAEDVETALNGFTPRTRARRN